MQRAITDEEIFERCVYSLINETFKMLEEGSALSPDDVDYVYVSGLGMNKQLGGLM